jgi:hypothetical protein
MKRLSITLIFAITLTSLNSCGLFKGGGGGGHCPAYGTSLNQDRPDFENIKIQDLKNRDTKSL